MQHTRRLMLAAAALALAAPSTALAQSMQPQPAPTASPIPYDSPLPSSGSSTTAPQPSGGSGSMTTPAPAKTMAPKSTSPSGDAGSPPGQIKKIATGSLTRAQVVYGLTHQVQAAKQLAKMKTVDFNNLRIYKLPTSLQSVLKVSDAQTQAVALAVLGNGVQYAQSAPPLPSANGNNSPIQYLHNVLANINVSNALNNLNVLNNSNVNLNVALSNVLNNNKISIGQVVGLYIGGGGIITTITK